MCLLGVVYIWSVRLLLLLILIIGLSALLEGQRTETSTNHQIKELTMSIVDSVESDHQRLLSIYQYVIHTISYDRLAYQGKHRRINRNSVDVLRRKKAVCWGYSELIREMCTYANIPCYTVTGYSKELPFPAGSLENANHAWNAVRLDDKWYLLDATWDSGLLSGEDYFRSEYGEDYYLTSPELFVKNHLPIMPMWQLLDCPMNLKKWKNNRFKIQTDCNYNYTQEINEFESLSKIEQLVKEVEVAYEFNQTAKNRSLMGHGLVDIAFEKKEKGEILLEEDEPFKAMEELRAAVDLFEVAAEYCEFYDWQEAGYIYAAVNLTIVHYQKFHEDQKHMGFLKAEFERTRNIILASRYLEILH